MVEARFTFDKVAELYGQTRPTYPTALFEDVLAAAGAKPGDALLEIGCGPGQATVGFAGRGLNITAVEPGAELIAVARRRIEPIQPATFVESTFEAWLAPAEAFQIVAAAQAIHWVPPEVRFAKSADVLRPGGVLAIFGLTPAVAPEPFRSAFAPIYARHAPELWDAAPERWYAPEGPIMAEFAASGRFEPATHRRFTWSVALTPQGYTDLRRTYSRYQLTPPERREPLLTEIAAVVERLGGSIRQDYEAHLYWARRR